jgi:hypothetical protein
MGGHAARLHFIQEDRMLNASAFVVQSGVPFRVSVTVNGTSRPVFVPGGQTVTVPITTDEFPAGTQVYPAVTRAGPAMDGAPCVFEPSAPSARYEIMETQSGWGVFGPTQD